MLQRQGKQLGIDFPTMPKLTQPLPSEIVDVAKERRKAAEKYSKATPEQRRVIDEALCVLDDILSGRRLMDNDGRARLARNCLMLLGEGGTGTRRGV